MAVFCLLSQCWLFGKDGAVQHTWFRVFNMRFIILLCLLTGTTFAEPWKRHTIDPSDRSSGKRGADGVRLADVNGDGLADIATGWEEGGAVAVYLNPGPDRSKTLWPSVTVGLVKGVEDAVFVDLDADGAVDVVSCAEGKVNNVFVHWAPESPAEYLSSNTWNTEAFPASEGRRWMFALPMDVNVDGRVDLVIGSKNENALVWLA